MLRTMRAKIGAAALLLAATGGVAAWAAGEAVHVDRQKWSFGGVLGHFDDSQLQRGFKVYTEVCARCHSIQRLQFRNLAQPGGPSVPEAAIKSLAAN
jgi:ubiquinol-cytochrome c reductase cytochrome c1 subunit